MEVIKLEELWIQSQCKLRRYEVVEVYLFWFDNAVHKGKAFQVLPWTHTHSVDIQFTVGDFKFEHPMR